MALGGTVLSPYVWDSGDDANGKHITITFTFDNTTRALSGATVVRDQGCLYSKILIGLGADGTPDTTVRVYAVPYGTTSISKQQLNKNGLTTIEDVFGYQITAGF